MIASILKAYYSLMLSSAALNKSTRQVRVIVSLTTIGPRIRKVHQVLKVILNQTYKVDRLIIFLSQRSFSDKNLPLKLKVLRDLFGVEYQFVEDLGPHTKYIYAIKENPEAIVITVDDDVRYPKDLVEELMNSYRRYPRAVSARRGHRITVDENKIIKKYNEWSHKFDKLIDVPSMQLFATGVGGVLYPPHCLHPEVFNLDVLRKLSLKNDDIWLKFMELLNGTPVVLTKPFVTKHINGSQKVALNQENVRGGGNDQIVINLVNHYTKFIGSDDNLIHRLLKN